MRRLDSPPRRSSCLSFTSFFKVKSDRFDGLTNDVAFDNEELLLKYGRYITEYTEADLDYEKDDCHMVDDDMTLKDCNSDSEMTTFDSSSRLKQLRSVMASRGVGVYIIPSEDEHQSEYTSEKDQRRQYISGFTGSAGVAVVTLTDPDTLSGEAALSTDGRYYLQAGQQLDSNWELLKQTVPSYPTWQQWSVSKALSNKFSRKISIDPKLISYRSAEWFEKEAKLKNLEFEPIFDNLIDLVWDQNGERPKYNNSAVYELDLKFSGVHTNDKISQIRQTLSLDNCESLVVLALDDIAWLLNLRGDDISFNPVFFSYVIVLMDKVCFYIDKSKLDSDTLTYLESVHNLKVKPYEAFWDDLVQIPTPMLPGEPTLAIKSKVESYGKMRSLISELKLIKNPIEISGAKSAQLKDGIALARFFAWLEYRLIVKGDTINEWELLVKNEYYRSVLPYYKSLSFETISSSGPNGAIIHYSPTPEKSDIIDPHNIYLCDSGGQYLDGTTDITRSLHFTKPTKEQIKHYTLVLKGHLALTMEVFPEGTTGMLLDILCRSPLWKHGLNYNHGTGHGIGCFLCVHEGPIYIGRNIEVPSNCFISDEPGFYKDGEYGIRLESDILCVKSDKPAFNEKGFLKFEYLTKVPFCRKLIDVEMLTKEEIAWINRYNFQLREELIPFLDNEFGDVRAIRWLLRETQAL